MGAGALDPRLLWRSTPAALRKFNPLTLWRNPVMFVDRVGAVLTTVLVVDRIRLELVRLADHAWLWLTVIFGNLAEAVAESRGRAQADTCAVPGRRPSARRLRELVRGRGRLDVREEYVAASQLRRGDVVVGRGGRADPRRR